MRKLIFSLSLIGAMSFFSCGPSAEEQKAIDEEYEKGKKSSDSLFNSIDSLWKKAEDGVKDSGVVTGDSTPKK